MRDIRILDAIVAFETYIRFRSNLNMRGRLGKLGIEKKRRLGLESLICCVAITQIILQGDSRTMSVYARERGGSEGGRASNYASTTSIGASMCGTTFPYVCWARALIMSGSEVPLEYGCMLSCDISRCFHRAYEEYEGSVRICTQDQSMKYHLLTSMKLYPDMCTRTPW